MRIVSEIFRGKRVTHHFFRGKRYPPLPPQIDRFARALAGLRHRSRGETFDGPSVFGETESGAALGARGSAVTTEAKYARNVSGEAVGARAGTLSDTVVPAGSLGGAVAGSRAGTFKTSSLFSRAKSGEEYGAAGGGAFASDGMAGGAAGSGSFAGSLAGTYVEEEGGPFIASGRYKANLNAARPNAFYSFDIKYDAGDRYGSVSHCVSMQGNANSWAGITTGGYTKSLLSYSTTYGWGISSDFNSEGIITVTEGILLTDQNAALFRNFFYKIQEE